MRYVGQDSARPLCESAEWLELRDRMAESLLIVCEAGCDWLADDGVRLMPEDREVDAVPCNVLQLSRWYRITLRGAAGFSGRPP